MFTQLTQFPTNKSYHKRRTHSLRWTEIPVRRVGNVSRHTKSQCLLSRSKRFTILVTARRCNHHVLHILLIVRIIKQWVANQYGRIHELRNDLLWNGQKSWLHKPSAHNSTTSRRFDIKIVDKKKKQLDGNHLTHHHEHQISQRGWQEGKQHNMSEGKHVDSAFQLPNKRT